MMKEVTKYWGPPGTGKTTKIRDRVYELLANGYEKKDFVITTFRRRMADELRDRLKWDKKDGGIINTIHGACRGLAGIKDVVDEKHRAEFCELIKIPYAENKKTSKYDYEPVAITGKSKLGNLFFDAKSFLVNNMLPYDKIYRYYEIEKRVCP